MGELRMPSLGADMVTGILVEWLVQPGDHVTRGQLVATVETAKGLIDIETFEAGVVRELLVKPGTVAPVGMVLAVIGAPTPVAAPPPPEPEPPAPVIAASDDRESTAPLRASPLARRLAAERGVDLAAIAGTGPDGAVRAADLERPAALTPQATARRFDPDAMRAAIAAAMERSKREIPHYYLLHEVDLATAEAWLVSYNAERPPTERVLTAALMLRAVARAARAHPSMNGFYRAGRFVAADGVHLGVAVSLRGGGLVTPALHDCDQRPLPELMAALADLVKRARTGRLRGSELTDGTLTVTSLGVSGVGAVLPVIYPPQVACVGFGKVGDRPRVDGDQLVIRPVVTVSLGADHRVSDGHEGALFLRAIDKTLNDPERLL